MLWLYNEILFRPILNLLIWLYATIPGSDLGIAIIVLTLIIKLILYPFTVAQIKQQKALQVMQPKIAEIRKRLKDDKEAQSKELMELYRKDKVNPVSSCLPLVIQLPVFIALYQALRVGLESQSLSMLYSFVPNPGTVHAVLFGVIDLVNPNYVLAALAAGVQFWQTWMMMKQPGAIKASPSEVAGQKEAKDEDMAAMVNKQMMYVMPIMTLIIGIKLPGGLALYWFVMSLLTVVQQYWLTRKPVPPTTEPQITQ
ncbi:MAG: YidC/Oxa1 family membrane protein insertase [Patescibacteria group bacterium]|jgi:YidC/Oxa1 family membrane protein insertase